MKTVMQFHNSQLPDGAWYYTVNERSLDDSNTCAGLMALAIEDALRYDKEFSDDPAVLPPANPNVGEMRKKAFVRLGSVIGTHQQRKGKGQYQGTIFGAHAWGDCYFLWCLERVAVIYDLKLIEGKDWYQWGSEELLKVQRPDGSWSDKHGADVDTSFALLFLTRANLAKDLTESIRARAAK